VLEAADSDEPKPNPGFDAKWDSPTWSPAPRTEAAQALPWLAQLESDQEVISKIELLSHDPVPVVRFLLASELWRLAEKNPDLLWNLLSRMSELETNEVVLRGVAVTLWRLVQVSKPRVLKILEILLNRLPEGDGHDEKARSQLVNLLVDFAVWDDNAWAKLVLTSWCQEPIKHSESLATSGHRLSEYIRPQQSPESFGRAKTLLLNHLDAIARGLTELQENKAKSSTDKAEMVWKHLYGVIDNTVSRIFFAAEVRQQAEPKDEKLTDEKRNEFFHQILPVFEKIIAFAKQEKTGMLLAPTAHNFVQLLNGCLKYDPVLVIRLTAEVVSSGKRFNYNLDSLAMSEIVRLVEAVLTDYRSEIQDEESINNLLSILDGFIEAGRPEARNLVWRLDEIFR
jgi:hypothetical protein